MEEIQEMFPRKGMLLWKKFFTRFLFVTVVISVLVDAGELLEMALGGRVEKNFLSFIVGELLATFSAIATIVWLGRKVTISYLYIYGEQAYYWINYNWKHRSGDIGFWGAVAAIAWAALNVYVANKLFPN
jgi:hypothetical protein